MSVQLLNQHVDRFNRAVRTGEWEQMTAHFTDDAELRFEGVPVGPFEGRETIARAYREQPPDDEVRLLDAGQVGDETIAGYAWAADPERRAGEMRLKERDGRIERLVVTFEDSDS
jgi:steroid Delta-isomerase